MGTQRSSNVETFLSTGQIASYCGVHFRTVIRWIEKGLINAQRLPGRGDYRVLVSEFKIFLSANKMLIPPDLETNKKILIVDDDRMSSRGIERVVRKLSVETVVANSGFQAGYLLHMHQPSAVTLDLKMPGMDGFEVLKIIRSERKFAGIKVLVISGESPEKLARAAKEGADFVLAKPYDPKELRIQLGKMLNLGGSAYEA